MIGQIFDGFALLFLGLLALAAFIVASIVGAVKREGVKALLRGLEAALLAFLGGLLARSFIGLLLAAADESPAAGLALGWGFFLWPGAVDTVAALFGEQVLTTSAALLWLATVVGGLTGLMDGLWRIHRWAGLGVLSFLLDVTWGLAGSFNGCLLQLVNFAWARHADEPRKDAHRYQSGFRFKTDYAFTQGAVMSNMGNHRPGSGLFAHERTHVWQNRVFGPLFTLTYLGWMVLMFLPGLIVGAAKGVGAGSGIEQWCYYNNPWEAWAYRVGAGPRSRFGTLVWSDLLVLVVSIPFFIGALAAAVATFATVWL